MQKLALKFLFLFFSIIFLKKLSIFVGDQIMTLEAVVYQQNHTNNDNIDLHSVLESCNWDFNLPKQDPQQLQDHDHHWDLSLPLTAPSFSNIDANTLPPTQPWAPTTSTSSTRPKRRRPRTSKVINKDDLESPRMTHVAMERNRRRQMNEYLYEIKSLIPASYAQRGDQASVVGGAIDFVKELEHHLHCLLSAQKMQSNYHNPELFGANWTTNVEATMVDRYANLKIRLSKHPNLLIRMVSGIQSLRLSIMHLTISYVHHYALYSIIVKVEEDSEVNSVDEIVTAVHELLGRIEEETRSNRA